MPIPSSVHAFLVVVFLVVVFLVVVADSIWPRRCIRAGVSNAIKVIALVV